MEERDLYEIVSETLKADINNFLFAKVPGSMTIRQFEDLTSVVYETISDAWSTSFDRERR